MNVANLVRWSGLATVAGGVLLLIVTIVELFAYGTASLFEAMVNDAWVPATVLSLVGLALITLGLVGLYARQSEQAGTLGLVAFLAAFAGMLMVFGFVWANAFILPELAVEFPDYLRGWFEEPPVILGAAFFIGLVLFDLGWLLFGVASLRAGVFPRGAAILTIIGAVLDFVVFFLGVSAGINGIVGLVLRGAIVWMGLSLWSEKPLPAPDVQH